MTPPDIDPDDALLDRIRVAYDTVAEPYADQFADELAQKPLDRALIDGFADQVRATGVDAPVADLGCGPGQVTRHLADRGLPVFGVDLSPEMVRLARERHPGLDFRAGSILGLAVADRSLAGVLSLYSVIHLPRPVLPRALAEFYRVLRPGGILLLAFHVGAGQLHVDTWFDRPVSFDGHLFDPDDVADCLAEAGFEVRVRMRRQPYPGIEAPTERAYLFAHRPAG
ncbi:class I SAM-dependent methyltransferase [Polymorphospora sp. NPDC050346]|uniref:class I SAM-dependent methyltransferase n=1 Tax=Polymorphospora sp. NPDC050346 TaxID=3155780 RepID=UPI0033FFCA2F